MKVDRESLLAEVDASAKLADVERELLVSQLTLDIVSTTDVTVEAWIAAGAPGARCPWNDPADHLVAGYVAVFGPMRVEIRPAPRRATGPDLFALVFGQRGRWARLERVWLRVHHKNGRVPRASTFTNEERAWTDEEELLARAIDAELSAGRPR